MSKITQSNATSCCALIKRILCKFCEIIYLIELVFCTSMYMYAINGENRPSVCTLLYSSQFSKSECFFNYLVTWFCILELLSRLDMLANQATARNHAAAHLFTFDDLLA